MNFNLHRNFEALHVAAHIHIQHALVAALCFGDERVLAGAYARPTLECSREFALIREPDHERNLCLRILTILQVLFREITTCRFENGSVTRAFRTELALQRTRTSIQAFCNRILIYFAGRQHLHE